VHGDGGIDVTRSFKAVHVRKLHTGGYCVHFDNPVDLASTVAVASIQFNPGFIGVLVGGCSSGAFGRGVQINIRAESGTPADFSFYVIVA
jgi:hypothetical protein